MQKTPFDQFMQEALYDPQKGYYQQAHLTIGKQGDFTTAPEISPLFGQCLAKQCASVLAQTGGGILELGAGTGSLACSLLTQLSIDSALPDFYWILELSASLKEQQKSALKKALPDYFDQITWLEKLPETSFKGVVLGNEVLDAIPVKRFQKQSGQWQEQCVTLQNDVYDWAHQKPEAASILKLQSIEQQQGDLPEGYTTEWNAQLEGFIGSLSDCLAQGVMLWIDYGHSQKEYYRPERMDGTLMCFYQHQQERNPLVRVGQQDITAHVNFTAVAEAALEQDLDVMGYTTQMMFLAACGIEQLAAALTNPLAARNQQQALMHPEQMGERFKVMALGRRVGHDLIGFSFADQRHFL